MVFMIYRALAFTAFVSSIWYISIRGGSVNGIEVRHDVQKPIQAHEAARHGQTVLQGSGEPDVNRGKFYPPATKSMPIKFIGLANLFAALEAMQSEFFEVWIGTWPTAIDWTAAVIGTHISATLHTFTASDYSLGGVAGSFTLDDENLVNKYFSHLTAYYFGEDAFGLRGEAYDDMLWVVLGWLENIQLIDHHSDTHFPPSNELGNSTWYGKSHKPAFAHRARIFYDLASHGWDETLCGGGMIWSPWLTPYKNAITNELFIAASINMYLYFPGDTNDFPFSTAATDRSKKHDKTLLTAAVSAYNWLQSSNMTNSQGLYFDGFHIRGWRPDGSIGSGQCDVPDHMVYTYNQGVILSGHRGLWTATGETHYLVSGHALVRAVIAATGWTEPNETESPLQTKSQDNSKYNFTWAGLGRAGIMEETCDAGGYCSQDGQTFKGIFFHHLAVFCRPLRVGSTDEDGVFHGADKETAFLHLHSCRGYTAWVAHNARAALATRDSNGLFGMWWTHGLYPGVAGMELGSGLGLAADGMLDYRNHGFPEDDPVWGSQGSGGGKGGRFTRQESSDSGDNGGRRTTTTTTTRSRDPNDRGRGRTVETQSGGVAVLRALYEFLALEDVQV
jgi:hypothetical protein